MISSRLCRWLFPLSLILLVFLFYYPSLSFDYVKLDDTILVANRIDYLTNPANIFKSFKESVVYWTDRDAFYYRPILTDSFILDGVLFNDNFWGYHLSNVFYHLISAILVFNFLVKLKVKKRVAGSLSFLFAAHPVLIQAVAWVPGRNDILLLIFSLASFFYFINYLRWGNLKDLVFFSLFFFLSVFTKETAIVLLLIFTIYYLMFWKGKNKESIRRFSVLVLVCLSAVFIWYFLAKHFSDRNNSYLGLITHTNWLAALSKEIIPAYLIYLGKIFLPISLSVFPLVIANSLNLKLGLVFLCLLLFSFFFFVKPGNKKLAVFGLLWFFLTLFPTLVNVMMTEPLIIYEHRLYLPIVGILIFLAQLNFLDKILSKKILFYPFLFLFLSLSFFINRRHIYKFKNSINFWEAAYSTSSNHYVTAVGLSGEYLALGDFDKAGKVFRRLDEIKPDSEISHLGFASLYYHKKDFGKARVELEKTLEKNPKSVRARFYLASLENELGNYDQAEKFYLEAVNLDNDNIEVLMALVNFYFRRGRIEDAKAIYKKVQDLGVSF